MYVYKETRDYNWLRGCMNGSNYDCVQLREDELRQLDAPACNATNRTPFSTAGFYEKLLIHWHTNYH